MRLILYSAQFKFRFNALFRFYSLEWIERKRHMVNNSFSKLSTFHSIQTVFMLEFLSHHASIHTVTSLHQYSTENPNLAKAKWRKKLFIDRWWHLSWILGVSGQEQMLFHASFWHRMLLISDVVLWKWKWYYMDSISIQFIITHSQL